MTLCAGKAPPSRGRINANAQRCGALAEPGHEYCVVHLKARGFRRCDVHGWTDAIGCCDANKPADEHARILAEMETLNKP